MIDLPHVDLGCAEHCMVGNIAPHILVQVDDHEHHSGHVMVGRRRRCWAFVCGCGHAADLRLVAEPGFCGSSPLPLSFQMFLDH